MEQLGMREAMDNNSKKSSTPSKTVIAGILDGISRCLSVDDLKLAIDKANARIKDMTEEIIEPGDVVTLADDAHIVFDQYKGKEHTIVTVDRNGRYALLLDGNDVLFSRDKLLLLKKRGT